MTRWPASWAADSVAARVDSGLCAAAGVRRGRAQAAGGGYLVSGLMGLIGRGSLAGVAPGAGHRTSVCVACEDENNRGGRRDTADSAP